MNKRQLAENLADLKEHETLDLVKKELEAGADPLAILKALREGMMLVNKRFETGEFYLPELILAGETFKEASDILRPALGNKDAKTKGQVVFGTVLGDIHDIGKDIVVVVLRGVGYKVHDMGVDVPAERFVEKLQETGASLLCLSGLITTSYDSMKDTVKALENADLRDRVKVLIGGGVINEKVLDYTGADAYGSDPTDALKLCRRFVGGN